MHTLAAICIVYAAGVSAHGGHGKSMNMELSSEGPQAFVYNPTLSSNGTQVITA